MGSEVMAIKAAIKRLPPPGPKRHRWRQYEAGKAALIKVFPEHIELICKLLAKRYKL